MHSAISDFASALTIFVVAMTDQQPVLNVCKRWPMTSALSLLRCIAGRGLLRPEVLLHCD